MGYAGYAPGKYAPPKPTEVQAALRQVARQDSYELLSKLLRNVVVNPSDDKYRRLRLSNPKIAATIVDVPGALDALLAMGWERDANDADFLVCPKGVRVTMAEVRQVEDAKDEHKRLLRRAPGKEAGRQVAAGNQQRLAIQAQLDADRRERSAQVPVAAASVAKPLPAGTNMRTAGEAGLNTGGCC